MTPDDIAILQKRLRLNRAQFARVLGMSAARLDSLKGKRQLKAEPVVETEIALRTLARLVDVMRGD